MHSKGNHQNKKTTYKTGENICKQYNWQGINLQNIQTAHEAQYQNIKQPKQKWAGEKHFAKEDIQMTKKNMKRYSTLLIIRQMEIKTTL